MQDKENINTVLEQARKRFRVETAERAGEKERLEFFKTAYRDQFNASDYQDEQAMLKRWQWANIENPNINNGQFPSWFCRDAQTGLIVGHLGVIPAMIKVKDSCYSTAWGREMIVPTAYRRMGIGSLLFNTVMGEMKNETIFFLLAGLNDYAVSIYKRLGFIHLGYIPLYARPIRLNNIIKRYIRNAIASGLLAGIGNICLKLSRIPLYLRRGAQGKNIGLKEITHFDSSFDSFWEEVSPYFPIIAKRDSLNLNWRFVNQPHWQYKIFKAIDKQTNKLNGYIVLREGQSQGLKAGVISDLFVRPDDLATITALFSCAVSHFEENKQIDLIRCDILGEKIERILSRLGFVRLRSHSHFMAADINQDLISREFVTNRDNWFISYADCDLDLSGSMRKWNT